MVQTLFVFYYPLRHSNIDWSVSKKDLCFMQFANTSVKKRTNDEYIGIYSNSYKQSIYSCLCEIGDQLHEDLSLTFPGQGLRRMRLDRKPIKLSVHPLFTLGICLYLYLDIRHPLLYYFLCGSKYDPPEKRFVHNLIVRDEKSVQEKVA